MFDLLLTDCRIATMQSGGTAYGAIEKAAIGTIGGNIAWVGKEAELPSRRCRQIRPLDGAWVTPGLIDCHTHFIFGGNRIKDFEARASGKSYADIAREGGGILSTMRATRDAGTEELIADAWHRLQPFIAEGVTTIEIKSGYGLTLADEQKCLQAATFLGRKAGVTVQRTFLGAHMLPPEFQGQSDRYIETICTEWLPSLHHLRLVDAVDGFCEEIAFSRAQIEKLFRQAHTLKLPVKLHAEQLSHLGGASLAARFNALSADHLEYAKEEDIAAMAQTGTVAVLLPGAYFCLRESQKPPIDLLRRYKVPMALASDHNPGTSPLASLLPCLALAINQFQVTPEEALAGVTRNAAKALRLHDRGIIDIGKRADLAVWQIDQPAELSYWIGSRPCYLRIRNGAIDDSPLL